MDMKTLVIDAALYKAVADAMERSRKKRRRANATRAKGFSKAAGKTMGEFTETVGKTVGGLTESAGKTVEGLGVMAGKTVEGLGTTLGKTAEGVGGTVGKTVGGLGEAVEKTMETTVGKTKEMTIGRVDEYRTNRRRLKLAKRRQKIRQRRMSQFGMYLGFALMAYLLYWWDQRRGRPIREIAGEAGQTLLKTTESVARTAQTVGSRASEQAGHFLQEAKIRLSAERGLEAEGNGHANGTDGQPRRTTSMPMSGSPAVTGSTTHTGEATTGAPSEESYGRSEVSAPGELRGASGPAVSTGMKVVAFDGVDIGRVQEVEEGSFILDRPRGNDLRVPQDAIARVEGTVVYLRIAADRVVKQGWKRVDSD